MRIAIIFLCLLVCSCSIKKGNTIFNVDDLGLTYKVLNKIGYKPVDEDASIYFKIEKDTIINIGFDRDGKSRIKEWVINIRDMDYNLVGDFLSKKQIFNYTPINFLKEDKGYSFVSIGQLDNRIYICKVFKDKSGRGSLLSITTTKSYSNEQIKKNKKYYNDLYNKDLTHPDLLPSIEDGD